MRRTLAVVLALTVLTPLLASGTAIVAAQDDGKAAGEYTIDELAEGGTQIEGADPSRRYIGESGSVFVSYQQTNIVKELGSQRPEWAVDKVVSRDKVVDTNEVRMHFDRGRNAGERTIHIVVLTWEKQQRPINNSTEATETVAVNVTKTVTKATLGESFEEVTVNLPDTEDPQYVTMYVREYPEARWVFQHDPVATSDSLPFGDSWASYLPWFASRFGILTGIGVPVAIAGAYKTLEATHTGPGKGVIWWLLSLGLGSYVAMYFAMDAVADLLVTAPWVMGVMVVLIAYVATLELADPTEEGLWEGIVTTEAQNPLGEELPDISYEIGESVKYVDTDDGFKLVKSSLSYFVTLLAGAKPPSITLDELETRVRYQGSASGDEKFYAEVPDDNELEEDEDPQLLYIRWPAISFGFDGLKQTVERPALPAGDDDVREDGEVTTYEQTTSEWDTDRLSRATMVALLGGAIGNLAGGGLGVALLGAVGGAWLSTVRRVDGAADWEPAPAHSTAAKARAVTEQQELEIASTFEELQQSFAEADATTTEQAVDIAEAYMAELRGQLDRLMGGDTGGLSDGPTPNDPGSQEVYSDDD